MQRDPDRPVDGRSFVMHTLSQMLGALCAAGVIYLVAVLSGAITLDVLELIVSGLAAIVAVAFLVITWRGPRRL